MQGIVVAVPAGLTLLVLSWLLDALGGVLSPLVKFWYEDLPAYAITTISIVLLAGFLYLLGLVTANAVGKAVVSAWERLVDRIPFAGMIHSASKQIVQAVAISEQMPFKSVVLVEFPSPGCRSVGFVTGSIVDDQGRQCNKILVPTTPNPTSGFFVIVAEDDLVKLDISVEDAVKMVMSGGIVSPDLLHRIADKNCKN